MIQVLFIELYKMFIFLFSDQSTKEKCIIDIWEDAKGMLVWRDSCDLHWDHDVLTRVLYMQPSRHQPEHTTATSTPVSLDAKH